MGNDSYFGVKLGDALSSGAGTIADALKRKYEVQNALSQQARQNQQQDLGTQAQMAKMGIEYDPNNPEAAFAQFKPIAQQARAGQQAEMEKTQSETRYRNVMADKEGMNTSDRNTISNIETQPMELAAQYGVKPVRPNPYRGMDEKTYTKVRSANIAQANRDISKAQKSADDIAGTTEELTRAKALLDKGLKTGPWVGMSEFVRSFGADGQEFIRTANRILPSMRQAGSGQTSDKDMEVYRKSTFGINKDESVNRRTIEQSIALNNRITDKAKFITGYNAVHGDTQGAEADWREYIDANPLFDKEGNVLKPKSYQEYFSADREKTSPQTGQPQESINTGWTPEKEQRLQELRNKMGR